MAEIEQKTKENEPDGFRAWWEAEEKYWSRFLSPAEIQRFRPWALSGWRAGAGNEHERAIDVEIRRSMHVTGGKQ